MRIKDPQRKTFKEKPVWTMDMHRNTFDGPTETALYAIYPEGKHFCVMYWDTCQIGTAETLDKAIEIVWRSVTMFDPDYSEAVSLDKFIDYPGISY